MALVANAGRYNLDLSNAPGGMGGGGNYLLPNTETRSIQATVRHELSTRLQLYLDGRASGSSSDTMQSAATSTLYNPLPSSAASNPFNQAIYVAVPVNSVNTRYTANTRTASTAKSVFR